jgi:GST-like protein
MACYPWINPQRQSQDITQFPHLARWLGAIAARPAVQRAYALVAKVNPQPVVHDEQSRKVLFGQDRNTVR